MLISKTSRLKWCPKIKKRYIELGYTFTKMGDEFEVKVEHLTKGSNAIVQWKCDGENCDEIITGKYQDYLKHIKEDGKIYCQKCATELFARPKILKTKLKNGISFEQWCLDNNRQDLLDRWDEEKNKCKPSEVSCGSSTPRWFKCDKHPEHHSELKYIHRFINGSNGSIECNQCNSVGQDIINNYGEEFLWKVWSDKNTISPFEVSHSSHTEVWWNCLNDKHEPYLRDCHHSRVSKYKCPNCFEHPRGKDHYNWNPDISQEEREIDRKHIGYSNFVKEVLKRDNYTCQITGQYGGKLEVHHLNGYHWDKENRLNPNNAVTLCIPIHKLFHKLYGCKNNTKEQFEEFLMKIEYGEIDISNIK